MQGPIITRRRLFAATLWTVALLAMNALAEPRESNTSAKELTVSAIVLSHCVVAHSDTSATPRVECRRNGAAFSVDTVAFEHSATTSETDAASRFVEVKF